jgi:two-component system sensor histidine kinase PilS (NtrC family)
VADAPGGPVPPQGPAGDSGLYRKLVWLTLFRIVTVSVLLGGAAMVGLRGGEAEVQRLAPLHALVVVFYAAALASSILLLRRRALRATAWAHVVLDVGVTSAVVAYTGRAESVFVFLYSLAIVSSAILLYWRGAVLAALLSIGTHLAISSPPLGGTHLPGFELFTQSSAFVATAALASYLAEQLRRTGETLAARETDLKVITALHETIVQSMTSGLLTLDPAGRVTFLNRAAEQLCGINMSRARGRPAGELFPPFEAETGRGEVEYSRRGEVLRLGYSSFPLLVERGDRVGTAVIFQDLTRLRAMEEAVQRSARLADLGRVAAGLAHELRNPLASMSGSLELLRAQADASEDDRRLMGIVLREASRLAELVSDFLRFARPPPLRRAPADLAGLLGETLEVFAHDPVSARVKLVADLSPARADCDADQVRQVVWNLLLNAAHATSGRPQGGTLRVSCAQEGERVRVEVEDDGEGIPAEDLEKIFMPFFTTRERGSGLGLATVHRVVDAHGGTVQVSSVPGVGARFTVFLPAAVGFAAPARAATL